MGPYGVDGHGEHLVLHSMRHTLVTRLLRAGTPLATVMQITGHKSVQMMMEVYGHLMTEDARSAMDSLPSLKGNAADSCHISATRGEAGTSEKRRNPKGGNGSPSRTRTCDTAVNSRLLYQLSYRGS